MLTKEQASNEREIKLMRRGRERHSEVRGFNGQEQGRSIPVFPGILTMYPWGIFGEEMIPK